MSFPGVGEGRPGREYAALNALPEGVRKQLTESQILKITFAEEPKAPVKISIGAKLASDLGAKPTISKRLATNLGFQTATLKEAA